MDFNFTDDQNMIFNEVKKFSTSKLNEHIFKDDETSRFPIEKWKLCGDFGILGLPVPEEYDGAGKDMLTTALGIKALSYGCKDEGLVFSICAHLCTFTIPLIHYGSKEQKENYLTDAATGKIIGGNGITEADAGSDNSLMRTTVEKNNGTFTVNGAKLFVTNGPVADALIIYAKHPKGMRPANISAFIIKKDNFAIGQHFQKMGLRTSPICEILLNDCTLKEDDLVGRERLGMMPFHASMLWERIIMSAYHIGAMERSYETVLDYANQRVQFGSKIIKYQNIADKLIHMKLDIELSNLLLYKTCVKYDNDQIDMSDAAMLKLFVSEASKKSSLEAVNIFAGYGYIKESIVEKDLRDSMSATIYSGTSEIQKNIISEKLDKIYE